MYNTFLFILTHCFCAMYPIKVAVLIMKIEFNEIFLFALDILSQLNMVDQITWICCIYQNIIHQFIFKIVIDNFPFRKLYQYYIFLFQIFLWKKCILNIYVSEYFSFSFLICSLGSPDYFIKQYYFICMNLKITLTFTFIIRLSFRKKNHLI